MDYLSKKSTFLRIPLTLLFLISALSIYSQNKKADSLWIVYNAKSATDTARLKAIFFVASNLKADNPDSSIVLANLMLQLAKNTGQKKYEGSALNVIGDAHKNLANYPMAIEFQNKAMDVFKKINYKKGVGVTNSKIASIYHELSDYPKALFYYSNDLKNCEERNDEKGVAGCLVNMGLIYQEQGNNQKALENYLKALKIFEELGLKKEMGICYTNLGTVYESQANYDKALEYYFKDLKITEEKGDLISIGKCYTNIGIIYSRLGNNTKALEYYSKDMHICEQAKNKKGLGEVYDNISTVYGDLKNEKERRRYLEKSLTIRREINDKHGIAASLINLSDIYNHQYDFLKAKQTALEALEIAQELEDRRISCYSYLGLSVATQNLKEYKLSLQYSDSCINLSKECGLVDNEMISHDVQSQIYSELGQYKSAFESHKKFKELTDSVFNIENSKEIGDMKTNFEVEKKETELKLKAEAQEAISKEEKKRQQIVIYSVAGLLFFALIFAGIMVNRFKVTTKQKRLIEIKEKETHKQNEIITYQKYLVEEKHKEITDSINYAERIQRSFLATKEILDTHLKDYFVFFQPKDVVSGDFYWAARLRNGDFLLATADSTGHGVPGAIMSILNISSLEKSIEMGYIEPKEIFNNTRTTIIERLKRDGSIEGGKDGMDCSLISFDIEKNEMKYSAANNPIWIVREGELIELNPDKMPIGKHDRDFVSFSQHDFDLKSGDVIYALTDGLPDQFGGPKGKKFMYKKLKELLVGIASLPMVEQKKTITSTLNEWKGSLEQVDDITLIGVRI